MGILSRFKDIMASNINAVFNKDEKHPEIAIEKYLTQLRSDLSQVKSETAALEMDVRRAQNALNANRAESAKLERYIERSNEAGNTMDAVQFQTKLDAVNLEGEKLEKKRHVKRFSKQKNCNKKGEKVIFHPSFFNF